MELLILLASLPVIVSSLKCNIVVKLHQRGKNLNICRKLSLESSSYDINAYEQTFSTCTDEVCDTISTKIPKDITGNYFKNVWGNFEFGNDNIMHPFDADGMIVAIQFEDGKAIFRNRLIGTKGYIKEKKAKKILFRNIFGTQRRGGFLANIFDTNFKNVANTNAIYWGNQLLALWEGDLPHRLEADSLRTFGTSRIRGVLQEKQPFGAHAKIDADKNRLINFSIQQSSNKAKITFYEFDQDFNVYSNRSVEIPGFAFVHDFVFTKNYYIFSIPPAGINPLPMLFGQKCAGECITYNKDQQAKIYIVSRKKTDDNVYIIETPSYFNFHYANGYEDEQGKIVIEMLNSDNLVLSEPTKENIPVWTDLDYGKVVPFVSLTRFTIEQQVQRITTNSSSINIRDIRAQSSDIMMMMMNQCWSVKSIEKLTSQHLEFPIVNPKLIGKKTRYIWANVGSEIKQSSPTQGLIKIDTFTKTEYKWMPEKYEYLSEPVYIQRNSQTAVAVNNDNEDDGYIGTYLTNGRDMISEFLLFSARDILQGPIQRIKLPVYMSTGLHGNYVDGLLFSEDDIFRKHKVNKALDRQRWNEMKGGFSGLGLSQ